MRSGYGIVLDCSSGMGFSDMKNGSNIDTVRLILVKYGFGTMFVIRKCMLILIWIVDYSMIQRDSI